MKTKQEAVKNLYLVSNLSLQSKLQFV